MTIFFKDPQLVRGIGITRWMFASATFDVIKITLNALFLLKLWNNPFICRAWKLPSHLRLSARRVRKWYHSWFTRLSMRLVKWTFLLFSLCHFKPEHTIIQEDNSHASTQSLWKEDSQRSEKMTGTISVVSKCNNNLDLYLLHQFSIFTQRAWGTRNLADVSY